MRDAGHKLTHLVEAITKELSGRAVGHCLRVDHLTREEAGIVCGLLRQKALPGTETYVLASETSGDPYITSDRAVELRNRKHSKLCLFVPADFLDPVASSLGNAFALFDTNGFLNKLAGDLRQQIPNQLQPFVQAVRSQLNGSAVVPVEDEISYYEALLQNPTHEHAGEMLWQVGLVPDLNPGEGFRKRLEQNRECVDHLARPDRPQASITERIDALGLKPNTIQRDLLRFLQGRSLQTDRDWLKETLEPQYRPTLTFEHWEFPEVEPSDLELIELEPFIDATDKVTSYCRLKQPEGPGTELCAECGARKYIRVKWATEPKTPNDVSRWRIMLIPDRDYYGEDTVAGGDLPETTVTARTRSTKLSMDIDLESLQVSRVQVRVTALDERGTEILGQDKSPVEGVSIGFWLQQADVELDEEGPPRKRTVRSLPDAWLETAMKLKKADDRLELSPQPVEEESLVYFPFLFSRRYLYRIGVSPFLRALQGQCLANPETGGRFVVHTSGVDRLTEDDLESRPTDTFGGFADKWEAFLKARARCFKVILSSPTSNKPIPTSRGVIEASLLTSLEETADNQVQNAILYYAEQYLNLVLSALTEPFSSADGQVLADILQVDTVSLYVDRGANHAECTLILPTHPLRLLWYLSYAELIQCWCQQLLVISPTQRRKALNIEAVQALEPVNLPAFISLGEGQTHVFAANIAFLYGLAFPPDTADPDSLIGEVARLIGYDPQDYTAITISPEVVKGEFDSYLELHDYVDCLRLNAVNPGSGAFLRKLGGILMSMDTPDADTTIRHRRMDIITHSTEGAQYPAPGLDQLLQSVRSGRSSRAFHLTPQLQMARCPLDDDGLAHIPGGDVHLSLCIDQFTPEIELVDKEAIEDSASVYGLLTQFHSSFHNANGESMWTRAVLFPADVSHALHPVRPLYTNRLIDLHQAILELTASVHTGKCNYRQVPAVCLHLGPDRRRILSQIHDHSDWVLTLDRNFGIEYFDSPKDTYLASEADRYLIDHTPEFIEGVGHRLFVTTAWQEEVSDILRRALDGLHLDSHPDCIANLLNTLKAISGRLALRVIGDLNRAKEVVGLVVAVEWMRSQQQLENAILIPVDAHLDLFQGHGTGTIPHRCDLLAIDISTRVFQCRFIEVKYRQANMDEPYPVLLDKMVDQIEHTEEQFRQRFFPPESRLDQALYQCQLASLLRFYLDRAMRHGWFTSGSVYEEVLRNIGRLEVAYPEVRTKGKGVGYIVSPDSQSQPPVEHRNVSIQVLGNDDIDRYTQFASQVSRQTQTSVSTPVEPDTEHVRHPVEPTIDMHKSQEQTPRMPDESTTEDTKPTPPDMETRRQPEDGIIRVFLGEQQDSIGDLEWKATVEGSPHLFILGSTGAGKSTTIRHFLAETTRQGLPSLIIDFHGDFVDSSRPFVKDHQPRIIDAVEGLPFSPLEIPSTKALGKQEILTNSWDIAEIVAYVCGLGEIQRDVVYEAVRDTLTSTQIAPDETFPKLSDVFDRLKHLEQERRGVSNTLARCRPLFEFGLFKDCGAFTGFHELTQQTTAITLKYLGNDILRLAAGAFVLRRLYKEMFLWGESDQLRLMVVLDEAHRLAKDTSLPKLMKEGRKFGVGLVVASQGIRDFNAAVLENAGTKLIFRTNYPDSKKAAQFLRAKESLGDLAKVLENLPVGSALAQTPEMTRCSRVQMFTS